MNEMLTDDDLTRLLGEAASAYPVPERGPAFVLEELGDAEPGKPWLRRRGVQLTAAAAAVVIAAVLAQTVGGSDVFLKQQTTAASRDQGLAPNAHSFAGTYGGGVGGGGSTGGTSGGALAKDSFGDAGGVVTAPGPAPVRPASGSAAGAFAPSVPQPAPTAAPQAALNQVRSKFAPTSSGFGRSCSTPARSPARTLACSRGIARSRRWSTLARCATAGRRRKRRSKFGPWLATTR